MNTPTIASVIAQAKEAGLAVVRATVKVNGSLAFRVRGQIGYFTKLGILERISRHEADLANAKSLAAKHGINVERGNGGYWVTCDKLDGSAKDPLRDSHFCIGGSDVLEGVQAYVKALS